MENSSQLKRCKCCGCELREPGLCKSCELLHAKPNNFDWNKYSINSSQRIAANLQREGYGCDECGDTYIKGELITQKGQYYCPNCIGIK